MNLTHTESSYDGCVVVTRGHTPTLGSVTVAYRVR